MKIFKNVIVLFVGMVCSYLSAFEAVKIYDYLFPSVGGGGMFISYFGVAQFIVGFCLSNIFFTIFLFTAFGDNTKNWWIGISLIPAVLFEVAFDMYHIYFPILLALIAWALGTGMQKLIRLATKKKV